MGTTMAVITAVITAPATAGTSGSLGSNVCTMTSPTIARADRTTDRKMATGAATTRLRVAITRTAIAVATRVPVSGRSECTTNMAIGTGAGFLIVSNAAHVAL